jgi:hypothetical protein
MRFAATAFLALALAFPAAADDVEASIDAALEAYRAGDIKTAKEELDFASQLLGQRKAAELRSLLPEPLPGWERQDAEAGEAQAMAAFGGGQMAGASYAKGPDTVEIQVMADNQMVTAMGAMFSSPAMMGSMGEVRRIGGEKAVLTPEGELQALIDGRIMVQITGTADAETKQAYFEAIDLDALKSF